MTHQGSVQDFTEEEILERVEAVAATGDQRALAILRQMIEDRQRTGEIHFFDRLAASPYLFGDRYASAYRSGERNRDSGSEAGRDGTNQGSPLGVDSNEGAQDG